MTQAVLVALLLIGAVPFRPAAQSDLDGFMATVLAARDENWKKLQQYVLDERDRVDVRGPGGAQLWGERREYTWYIREGFFVQSPVSANGVAIPEADRRKAEDEYLKRAQARDRGSRGGEGGEAAVPPGPADPSAMDMSGILTQTRQPGFMDSAYFLRFKFEPGHYAFVGRESLNGQEVLRVEYYPARLFTHEQDAQDKRRRERTDDRQEDTEAALERMMNKVSLVTLWIEPTAHQIVKYTFDNVNLDFLPAAWLLRLTDMRASMTMGQPFAGVWLPQTIDMQFGVMLAVGQLDVRYGVDYHDYRQAETSGRLVPAGR
jgi:hypothetical protein